MQIESKLRASVRPDPRTHAARRQLGRKPAAPAAPRAADPMWATRPGHHSEVTKRGTEVPISAHFRSYADALGRADTASCQRARFFWSSPILIPVTRPKSMEQSNVMSAIV